MNMSERNEALIALQNELIITVLGIINTLEEKRNITFTREEITNALKASALNFGK